MTTLFAYNGCRFQLQRDRYGRHRWYVYNASGTRVDSHSERFSTELEARRDAEQFREQIAKAPIIGEA
jgi:hypothetical protein